ncbi:protoporphyrinogen oxidase HemJ [Roseitranquillus sediminis]|uniref:protoporphyrinogen oxidase HemJ n=1 Tax=Roseitranquillus sediminis TaxID=2809051 RepID=UPI001D0CD87F|nr:protoporphyrinogen oxidase HemJ [Roseitranquillus sediminis]MBM9596228.1 protoporphyrinogen oxidase HemJ [Roseitranquillus sediminis]
MYDLLSWLYPWTKALHVISMVTWMAGLFYLPRLFVYHVEAAGQSGPTADLFETMERKLLRLIMNPAMIATWFFGLMLVLTPGVVDWGSLWPWTKATGVLSLTWFHHWLGWRRRDLAQGANKVSGRGYRIMNEVPTVFLVVIVVSVIVKF